MTRHQRGLLWYAVWVMVLLAGRGHAATISYWTNGSTDGNWETAGNWTEDATPSADYYTWFNSGTLGNQTITINGNATSYYIYLQSPANGAYTINSSGAHTLTVTTGNVLNGNANYDLTLNLPVAATSVQAMTKDVVFNGAVNDGLTTNVSVKNGTGRAILNGGRTSGSLNTFQLTGETSSHAVLGHGNAVGAGAQLWISTSTSNTPTSYIGLTTDVGAEMLRINSGDGATMNVCVETGDTDRTLTLNPAADAYAAWSASVGTQTVVLGDNFNGDAGHITVRVQGLDNGVFPSYKWVMPATQIKSGNRLVLDAVAADSIVELYENATGEGCVFTGDGTLVVASNVDLLFGNREGTIGDGGASIGGNLTVQIDGSLDIRGKSQTWAALTGSGSVLLDGATLGVTGLAPGNSAGTATIDDSGTVNVSGTSTFELASLSGTSDQVIVTSADFNLAGVVNIVDLGDMEEGDYVLVDMGAGTATLDPGITLNMPGSWDGSLAVTGGDVVLTVFIPEPATLALLALGGLVLVRRRKR